MKFAYEGSRVVISNPNGTGTVAKTINKGRFYEEKFLKYIEKQGIDGTYIDVGANIGNHTIFFAKFTKADNVISLEPNPKVYKTLTKNIKDNNIKDTVSSYNVAAGKKKGRVSIKINPDDEIGSSSTVEGDDIDQWTLDTFIDKNIKLIKLDVEGYEYFVLQGATKILKTHKPDLFIEITTKKEYKEIFDLISKFGYKKVITFNNSATHHFSVNKTASLYATITNFYPFRRLLRYS